MTIDSKKIPEHCLLIGTGPEREKLDTSMKELDALCYTANVTVLETVTQLRPRPDKGSYVGSGKIVEIQSLVKEKSIPMVITNDELTPNQAKHLEKELQVKVLDRTGLILDIFAARASTKEAQLQVELAQLQYLYPRLTRMWTHLSRLGGGIGTRGPGEKQLEVDKRQIRKRIGKIEEKLGKISQDREQRRSKRKKTNIINFGLVGYTNAGKSTVLNHLTEFDTLTEDKLFATLDPLSKSYVLPNNEEVILTDTVGFIEKLPHTLIKAFRSTLEETIHSDFHLHIVDLSDPNIESKIETVNSLLKELNADQIPKIYVFNKLDIVENMAEQKQKIENFQPQLFVSVKKSINIKGLIDHLTTVIDNLRQIKTFHIPPARADILHLLHQNSVILDQVFEGEQYIIKVRIHPLEANKILAKLENNTTTH